MPLGTSQELAHSMEHRIFLDPKIAALEDATVRHNGMTCWSGIRLEFTVRPERLEELREAVIHLFSGPLPKMSFEERERFARELEEGGGDFFDRALDRFRTEFSKANGFEHSGKGEDEIWSDLDFSKSRMLVVGETLPRTGENPITRFAPPWLPASRSKLVFPVLKGELNEKERDFLEIVPPDAGMEYVLLLPSIIEDARDYAFHCLFFHHLRLRADIDFRDSGRTYDPIAEDYFEDGFVVSGIHLVTSDRSKKLPALPKKPAKAEFEKTRDSLAFQASIYLDQLLYGTYPVIGIGPSEGIRAIAGYPYDDFVERFDRACERVCVFWGRE